MSARSLVLAAILLTVHTASCLADLPSDAVVRITAKRADNRTSVGTGTLISGDGSVLTCYHVIRESIEIKVAHKSRSDPYELVRILSILPDYDIAILKIESFPSGQAYLELSAVSPSAFSTHVTAWGYPANFGYSLRSLRIDGVDQQWTKASTLRTLNGADPVFRDINLDLLTMNADIESGSSGGPILSNGKIVGVISGSWSVGGIVSAWAIPVKYVTGGTPVNSLPRDVRSWAPLNLTADTSALGRSEVSLTAPLVIALGQYGSSLNALRDECAPISGLMPQVVSYLQQQINRADEAVAQHGSTFVVSSDASMQASMNDPQMFFMLSQLLPCTAAFNSVHSDGDRLSAAVEEYLGDVAHIEREPTLFSETKENVGRVSILMNKLDKADAGFVYPGVLPSSSTIGDYETAFKKDVSILNQRDPAKLYQDLLAELAKYNETVNKLIRSHASD
ncbi:MAG: degQ [Edaphobacter sp.]|nr:degQ [Edaphobacter sp.]